MMRDGKPLVETFPSKAFEVYRRTAVGQALLATLSEFESDSLLSRDQVC
jgi:hypothetical protein